MDQTIPPETQPNIPASIPPENIPQKSSFFNGKLLVLLLGVAMVVIGITLFVFFQQTNKNAFSQNTSQPQTSIVSPTIKPDITFDRNTNNILYTVDKAFTQVGLVKNLEPNQAFGHPTPYFDEENEKVYLAGANQILEYDLNKKTQKDIYTNNDKSSAITSFNLENNLLYVSFASINMSNDSYIEEYDLLSKKTRKIAPLQNVLYGSMHYLFKTTKNDDVVGSFGGDGCGGFGEIRLVTTSGVKVVTQTGGGCAESPRRLGSLPQEDKVVLLSVEGSWVPTEPEPIDKLYTKDVYTGEEKILMDLKPYVATLKSYYMDEKNKKIMLTFNNGFWIINASTGQVESKDSGSDAKEEFSSSTIYKNKAYYIENESITDNFNMILHVTDLKTRKEIEKINWGKKHPLTGDATIIGFWHDQPLISLYIYPPSKN